MILQIPPPLPPSPIWTPPLCFPDRWVELDKQFIIVTKFYWYNIFIYCLSSFTPSRLPSWVFTLPWIPLTPHQECLTQGIQPTLYSKLTDSLHKVFRIELLVWAVANFLLTFSLPLALCRVIGQVHYQTARATQKLLQDYKGLQDIIAILGKFNVRSSYCT